jgi:hemerythrin-like domain-containing protein
MKSTDFLTQEHKLILRALDVLDAVASLAAAGTKPEEEDVDNILEFLRWFADAHHQAKEETVLFPVLKSSASAADRAVQHMIFEHGQERSGIEELETHLRVGQTSDFVSSAGQLSSRLRNHIYKEDQILFVQADTLLDSKTDETVFEQLTRFDTPLDKQSLEEHLGHLRRLEWKYLRK